VLVEGIVGHKLIKTHGMEDHFYERFQTQNEGYVDTSLKASRIQSIYRPSSAAMVAIGIALVIFYGGQEAAAGHLSIGEIVLFGIYFAQLVGPMRMFARLIMFYNDAIASARRVFEVIDIGEDVPEAEDPVSIEMGGDNQLQRRVVQLRHGQGDTTGHQPADRALAAGCIDGVRRLREDHISGARTKVL